jgi:hypothetical protein
MQLDSFERSPGRIGIGVWASRGRGREESFPLPRPPGARAPRARKSGRRTERRHTSNPLPHTSRPTPRLIWPPRPAPASSGRAVPTRKTCAEVMSGGMGGGPVPEGAPGARWLPAEGPLTAGPLYGAPAPAGARRYPGDGGAAFTRRFWRRSGREARRAARQRARRGGERAARRRRARGPARTASRPAPPASRGPVRRPRRVTARRAFPPAAAPLRARPRRRRPFPPPQPRSCAPAPTARHAPAPAPARAPARLPQRAQTPGTEEARRAQWAA